VTTVLALSPPWLGDGGRCAAVGKRGEAPVGGSFMERGRRQWGGRRAALGRRRDGRLAAGRRGGAQRVRYVEKQGGGDRIEGGMWTSGEVRVGAWGGRRRNRGEGDVVSMTSSTDVARWEGREILR
jgi:hypothetical protein